MSVKFTVYKGSLSGAIGKEVLVRVTHAGICGTDEHYKHAGMVLGHEGIGTVKQIGESVSQLKVGDVVGWGIMHNACGMCEPCMGGNIRLSVSAECSDQYCVNGEGYGRHNLDQGSFGSHAVWEEAYLFKVPDGLAPEHAAPLICAGATVFGAVDAVIGVGGLGHLAIQFLAKIGAEVVVFSSTESKRDEALRLGASEFYATHGVTKFETRPLDHLLITTSILIDSKPFLDVMKPASTLYPMTASGDNLVFQNSAVVLQGITIQGSIVASRAVHKRMLDFAARNHIAPIIECFPMKKSGVEEGMARLREGKMRYRGVLVA
ncbi:chaperonin 10-like protein [Mycena pura]|uniref:Chaperonin 10-like protein n=1 Tax=Mycena pura TaxID=153505 RepID=A0AAD6VMG9_9AGAR|nr:chaperonin 10-like protein [Mycena pura]